MERLQNRTINQMSGTKLTVYTGLFVCFGIILPYVSSHAYGIKGIVFLPMHIPVLLCGFFCGAKRGFLCGLITPTASSLITNMPPAYPMLPIMLMELSTYGLVSGALFQKLKKAVPTLVVSMIAGRIMYASMFYLLLVGNPSLRLLPNPVLASMPILSMFIVGIPGVIIQLVLIPTIVLRLKSRPRT